MVVSECISALKFIKDTIVTIKHESDTIEKIKTDNTQKVITFAKTLFVIKSSIELIIDVTEDMKEDSFNLDIAIILNLKLKIEEFLKILIKYREWTENIINGTCFVKCKTGCVNPPSKMDALINEAIDNSIDISQIILDIQTNTIGSAKDIHHPILKKVWVCGRGKNQLNDTQVSTTMLTETLYTMLEKEEGGTLFNPDYCKKMINSFIELLDGSLGTAPDGIISILELNKFEKTEENVKNVKGLLGFDQLPDKEAAVQIPIDFKPMCIDHSSGLEMPQKDDRYGSGFCNKMVHKHKIPSHKSPLFGIIIRCNVEDQGWGGTGHAQIRYSINGGNTMPMIIIWRDRNPSGNYEITLGPDKIKQEDELKLWLYCPGWNGWKCKMNSLEILGIYSHKQKETTEEHKEEHKDGVVGLNSLEIIRLYTNK